MEIQHEKVWYTPSDIPPGNVATYVEWLRKGSAKGEVGNLIISTALKSFLEKRILVRPDVYYRTFQANSYYRIFVLLTRTEKLKSPDGERSFEDLNDREKRYVMDRAFMANYPDKAASVLNVGGQRPIDDEYYLLIGAVVTDEPLDIEYICIQ